MKKHLSLFLVLCMLLSTAAQLGIGSVTLAAEPVRPVTETAEDVTAEDSADYIQGVMLFALDSAERLDELADALANAGVHSV